MKFRFLLAPLLLISLACASFAGTAEKPRYAVIDKPFVNIYKELDPKSAIIKLAKAGEEFRLDSTVQVGGVWCRVVANDGSNQTGWVELEKVRLVSNPEFRLFGMPGAPLVAVLVFLLLGGCGIAVYIVRLSKQNDTDAAA